MNSYLNLSKNILRSNFGRLAFPYKLTFAITYRCNYRCRICNIWKRAPAEELTLDEFERFFRKSNGFNWIDFTGGEVWLRKDFTGIIEAAIRNCRNLLMLHFPTNGYMTDQIVKGVESIMKMNPPRLVVSCSTDGDEAVNDYVRGVKGGWKRQIETFKRLRAIPGVQVFLSMTLSSYNADQYEKAFEAAKKECPWLKPTDFHMNIAHESAHYYGNAGTGVLEKNNRDVIEQVKRYMALRGYPRNPIEVVEWRYLKNVEKYLSAGVTPMRCHALRSSCFIDPFGDVYPCAMYDAKVASLREHDYDLQAVWDTQRARILQEGIWEYKCPQCWTPCEAYQSIFGNLLGNRDTPLKEAGLTRTQAR